MRTIIGIGIVSLFAVSAAQAQYPGGYPGGSGYGGYPPTNTSVGGVGYPGLYGGGLSPYLNLRSRNVNSAVNYFNFVRPYTGGTYGNAFVPAPAAGPTGRQPFFPVQVPVYADEEPARQRIEKDDKGIMRVDMPPAGHPAGFMNTQGYFGSPNGLQGFGAGRPPAATLGTPRRR
jgi:hypothetical protein